MLESYYWFRFEAFKGNTDLYKFNNLFSDPLN
jgi:hypothetical protein